ncbi:hypothetical protein ACJA28_00165 [Mesomycoplasma moatsii]|uniref:hypothetical protein n=1 Tax=Mesomycoplasma moatsii TaxID=171287 RepID=UPI0003B73929
MKIKIRSLIWYVAIGITLGISISFTIILINKIINKNNKNAQSTSFDWSDKPAGFKEFSSDNSFKVDLQSSDIINGAGFQTSGTAWSWYYENINSNTYDWYLMTNFHVVNDAIAYVKNFTTQNDLNKPPVISQPNNLLNYYSQNSITNIWDSNKSYLFSLSKWSSNFYNPIITTRKQFNYNDKTLNFQDIKSIDLITDFDNKNINLFSKENDYNLDMSLIKIRVDLSNKKYLINDFKCPNIYDIYENKYTQEEKNNIHVSNEKKTYIAGNPYAKKELVGVVLEKQKWSKNESNVDKNDPFLDKLKAPYYYSIYWYENFALSSGASGSAVYQIDDFVYENDSYKNIEYLSNLVPIGIYWGGTKIIDSENFKPSFIPFVIDNKYNIFDNFKNYLNPTY